MDTFKSIRNNLKYYLAPYPKIFIFVYRLMAPQHNRLLLISAKTDLVIEGFPRSGNTFAVVAFQQAQQLEMNIAHHLHAEAQILQGVKNKIPVLVLIREPTAAITSLIVRHPNVKVQKAYHQYIRFYAIVSRVKSKVVIADFNETISDFGSVTERLNQKFETSFDLFVHTQKNVERVFQEINQINLLLDGGKETHVARPSAVRKELTKTVKPIVLNPELINLRGKAQALYDLLRSFRN